VSGAAAVLALTSAWIVLLGALGSGPAALFAGPHARLLLAPPLGLALGASLCASASLALPMRTAAWVILLPAALVSSVVAVYARQRRPLLTATAPLVLATAGVLLALAPALLKGTTGPFTYAVADVWGAVTKGLWLAGNDVLSQPELDQLRGRLAELAGAVAIDAPQRIALPALSTAGASAFGIGPAEAYYPLSCVVFGLVPISVWLVARRVGASLAAAMIAAVYGSSAATLTLVVDGAAENLAGVALAPLVVLFTSESVASAGRDSIVRAGLAWAGVVSIYPEYVPALGAISLVVVAVLRPPLATASRRLAGVAGLTLLVAPYSCVRAVDYYLWLGDPSFSSGASRDLTLETTGAWAFGILHLYQLDHFDLLSPPKQAVALGLPLALVAVAALGLVRAPRRTRALVGIPALLAVGTAVFLYRIVNDQEYALWKLLLLALPFVAVAIALGLDALAAGPTRPAALAIVAAALFTIFYGDVEFTRLVHDRASFASEEARSVAAALQDEPKPHVVFLEGAEAMPYPLADYIGLYTAFTAVGSVAVGYAAIGAPAGQGSQLLGGQPPGKGYLQEPYRYVLTTFAGLDSGRRIVASRGRFALEKRAPIDVLVAGVDAWTGTGERVLPYATGPFELWVSAARPGKARVEVALAGQGALAFSTGRSRDIGGSRCTSVKVGSGPTRVLVTPLVDAPTAPLAGTWQSDSDRVEGLLPAAALPGVALGRVSASWGPC
jgi:hypothetical protein